MSERFQAKTLLDFIGHLRLEERGVGGYSENSAQRMSHYFKEVMEDETAPIKVRDQAKRLYRCYENLSVEMKRSDDLLKAMAIILCEYK